jgi:hypothetical protein
MAVTERRYAGPAKPHPLEVRWREPEPGFWFLYARRGAVWVPARIWLCDHAPHEPDNLRDRWPVAHLAGEIGGRWVDPTDIWRRVLLRETNPGHWSCAQPLVPKDGLTVAEEYEYQMALLEHAKERGAMPTRPIVKLRQLVLPW